MKTRYIILSLLFAFAISITVQAQKPALGLIKKEEIKVWGECGMCAKRIATAAKNAGATSANWDEDSKILVVSYERGKTSSEKIQKSVAAAGHDTKDFTASNESYNSLPECCHYQRKETVKVASINCCKNEMACSKISKCCSDTKDDKSTCVKMEECKQNGCCKS